MPTITDTFSEVNNLMFSAPPLTASGAQGERLARLILVTALRHSLRNRRGAIAARAIKTVQRFAF
jgi:hypothetical protein